MATPLRGSHATEDRRRQAHDLLALDALLPRPDVDARTRRAIEDEIWSIRIGAKAESDAAYQLDFDLKKTRRWAVIHDLRLDIDGQVAQIDHLVRRGWWRPRSCPGSSRGSRAPQPARSVPLAR